MDDKDSIFYTFKDKLYLVTALDRSESAGKYHILKINPQGSEDALCEHGKNRLVSWSNMNHMARLPLFRSGYCASCLNAVDLMLERDEL